MIPTLETKRLFLKGVTLENAPDYYKHFVDWDVVEMLGARVPWPYPQGAAEDYIKMSLEGQGKKSWLWGLFLKTHPQEMIGAIELFSGDTGENRGFWLGKKFWGQGLMTEAVYVVNDFAFSEAGFRKLILKNAVENKGSHRIKEKTGATYIKTVPSKHVNPTFNYSVVWELTKEKWEKFKNENPI